MNKTIRKGMLAVGVAASSALCGASLLAPSTFAAGSDLAKGAFGDQEFFSCVVKQYNALNNKTETVDTLTKAQVESIKELNCNYTKTEAEATEAGSYLAPLHKISDTTGMTLLTGLKKLYLAGHNLGNLDLHDNRLLTDISIYSSNLTNLVLTGSPNIKNINIGDNKLTSLDLSKQADLAWLQASYNQLTELNVSENTKLVVLEVVDNDLTTLDLTKNAALTELFADNIIVKPYTEYGKTDNCELTALLKFVGTYNTIVANNNYSFNNDTHTLTVKSLPSTSNINVVEVLSAYKERSATYRVALGNDLKTEFDKLSTCEAKVPDTDANSGVKTPDTGGSLTEEFDGKVIGASILSIAAVALLGFIGAYTYSRRKNHIKF